MARAAIALALSLSACASAPRATGETIGALPRVAACELSTEPGISRPDDGSGVECIPPRRRSAEEEARLRNERGDYLGAGDCMVAAYEEHLDEPRYALEAAEMFRRGGRAELSRIYFERFLAASPDDEQAEVARQHLRDLPSH